jgi:tRNA nucleotidyltransferase (CCA-adding enzyme)
VAELPAAQAVRWEQFAHDADLGVRGYGDTLARAFEQTALALAAAVVDPRTVADSELVEIDCEAPNEELLLVDWLNAIIYEMATRNLCFARFAVEIDGRRLHGRAWGEPLDARKHDLGVEAKGATYTALRVAREANGLWLAQCIVDV